MKEEVYTAPANFKRGKLIVGSYKVSDLIIIGVGVFIAIGGILLSVFTLEGIGRYFGMALFLFIGMVAWFITISFPAYHNMLGFLLEMYDYLIAQKVYTFEGVIHYDEEKNREETGERRYSWEEKDI